MIKQYKLTIFTPLHNGANTISRVYNSLKHSIYRNFEWIIINDGSTDDSYKVICSLVSKEEWDITLVNWPDNRGKHVAWNYAVSLAKGDIFICVDCDDAFVASALSIVNDKWNKHYDDAKIYGIDFLCVDHITNEVCGTRYPSDGIVSNYKTLYSVHKIRGDKWNTYRLAYLRQFKFPEIKANYYTECFLHYSLGEKYYVVGYNENLYIYYMEMNSITHTIVPNRNNLYMIAHYQMWHIPRVALWLIVYDPKELYRCIKELISVFFKFLFMYRRI